MFQDDALHDPIALRSESCVVGFPGLDGSICLERDGLVVGAVTCLDLDVDRTRDILVNPA